MPESATAFYLSLNNAYDATDQLLGSRIVGRWGPRASSGASTEFALPPGTAAGSYYVIAVADASGAVAESLENNNTRASAIVRIGPDFTVTAADRAVVGGRRHQHQRQRHHEESGRRHGAAVGHAVTTCRPTRRSTRPTCRLVRAPCCPWDLD